MYVSSQKKQLQGLGDYTLAVNVVGKLPGTGLLSQWGAWFSALGPVGWAVTAGLAAVSLISLWRAWSQRGELKIAATAKAEDFVESIWGTLKPDSPPETDSVSKQIENCQLNEAQSMITFLARQMYEKAKDDQYFRRWADEWGLETLRLVQRKLDAYLGYCQNSNEPVQPQPSQTVQCPPDFTLQNGTCVPLSCPPGFYLKSGVCTPLSPATLPPAISTTGQYVPLPQATASSYGILGILAVALAAIVISR